MSAETILTLAGGRSVDLLQPTAQGVDWNAYAEHLAKEPRYNGATPGHVYSVAQHSVLCADEALKETGDRTLAAYLLVHDVHEAVLRDDTTPKKRALAALAHEHFGILGEQIVATFKLLEYRHDVAIHESAGLAFPVPSALQPLIKQFDQRALLTEWRDLMGGIELPARAAYGDLQPFTRTVRPWTAWQSTRGIFIERCNLLLPAFNGGKP